MKMVILDVLCKVSKVGKPYNQAAIRGTGKKGDFLFIAVVPDDVSAGEVIDRNVVFNNQGSAYVLPY